MARPRKDAPQVDWSAIHADWQTGQFSNAQLARKYGLAASTVNNRAARDQWSLDGEPLPDPHWSESADVETPRKPDRKASRNSMEALRKRAKDLAQRLLSEVEDITTHESEIADIIIKEESDPLRRRAALKAISAETRIKMAKDLAYIFNSLEGRNVGGRPKSEDKKERTGKKEQQQEEAAKVAAGRFAPRTGPRLVSGGN